MNIKQRVMIVGTFAGMTGGVLTLASVGLFNLGPGGALGAVIAASLGAGAAWIVGGTIARSVVERLTWIEHQENALEPSAAALGWTDLDEELSELARSLRSVNQVHAELVELERLARGVEPSSDCQPQSAAGLSNGRFGVRRLIDEFRRTASQIAESANTLGEAIERMSGGAGDQTETVGRTTHTVEALSDRIDRISQNAEEAAEASQRARQEARRGLEQIQEIIAGMERLRAHVEANARKARRLGDRSMEIEAIVELISGISSRTDMLALNATIESVRAGEHGRGFAVVAEEIRKLAERTATATRDIGALVEAIQADAQESVRALAEEQTEMEQETRSVRQAEEALERISQVSEHSARLVESISHSANDQVEATQDLVTAMQRISEASKLIRGEMTHVRKDALSLKQQCGRLLNLWGVEADPAEAPEDASPPSRNLTRGRRTTLPVEVSS